MISCYLGQDLIPTSRRQVGRPTGQSAARPTALSQVTPREDTRAYSQEIKSPPSSSSSFAPPMRPLPGRSLIRSVRARLRLCLIGDVGLLSPSGAGVFVGAFHRHDASPARQQVFWVLLVYCNFEERAPFFNSNRCCQTLVIVIYGEN